MRHSLGAFFPKTPRSIRLGKDLEDMKAYRKDSTIFDFEAIGDPPEKYIITFHGHSLVPTKGGGVTLGNVQKVELSMGTEYPTRQPQIRWMTPIVHPNISAGGGVCLGNYGNAWTPYFKLVDLIEILWDYSRMAVLNPHGGYGGRTSVEGWEKLRREFKFPVDLRPLRDKVLPNNVGSSVVRPGGDEYDIVIMPDDEGECG